MSETTVDRPRADDEALDRPPPPPPRPPDEPSRSHGVFVWVSNHVKGLVIGIIVFSVVIAAIGLGIRVSQLSDGAPEDPAFDPGGAIYDTQDRVEELFDPATEVVTAVFFVESPDASSDVLTQAGLSEFLANATELEDDAEAQGHLTDTFDNRLGIPIDGVQSIAHAVDEQLEGGLANASDAEVKVALSEVLDESSDTAGLRATLSQLTSSDSQTIDGQEVTVWRSPAFQAQVAYLRESFDIDDPDSDNEDFVEYEYTIKGEEWLRDVQDTLRGDQDDIAVIGLAIDGTLTEEEQSASAAPFIMGAIVLIVLLVGALIRSYWASTVVAVGLALTFLAYSGVIVVVGLKDSILLTFIIPIAVLSFGVDFFIHDIGRCREEQVSGASPIRAYPIGMTAVAAAVLLAVSTSIAAFLANVSSSIEAVQQFGIAAAIGLALAYLFIGIVGPRVVLGIEERLGTPPRMKGPRLGAKLGFLVMSVAGGLMVTFSVVQQPLGVVLMIIFVPLFVYLPYRLTRRRNQRAVERGRVLDDEIHGAGHGMKVAGSAVHFFARWRVVTVPVVVLLAIAGIYGYTQVDEEFDPADFTSSDTDFIQSLEVLDVHYGESTGITAYLYVEGDLTDPSTLVAMDQVIADVDAADSAAAAEGGTEFLAREFDGEPVTSPYATDVVRAVLESPEATAAVQDSEGVQLTAGPDGLPTDPAQVAAIYRYTSAEGIPGPDGTLLWRPEDVHSAVFVGDDVEATRVEFTLNTVSDLDIARASRTAVEDAQATFEESTAPTEFVRVDASGEAITGEDSLTTFTSTMLTSLLVAFVLCTLIAWAFMRSLKYAVVSVVPILLVVGWIYLFMYIFDYSINPVTATIAAIAVGVGVDFAMHFTMRFREEFKGEPSRFPALRRAGEGTGGALVLSALTSMGGFLVMALAPMPIFADFGLLTAVMIFFSLVVALLVLPSLLLLVTPSRQGEERQRLLDALRTEEYDPHSRETAIETAHGR